MSSASLTSRRYRFLDVVSKLAGVGLLAGGLELGITSAPGIAIAGLGVIIGVSTVFISRTQ